MAEIEIDRTPLTVKGTVTRYSMVKPLTDDDVDYSPQLPAHSAAQALQTILATSAPVPQRNTEPLVRAPNSVSRDRLAGDSAKSTATERMLGATIAIGLGTIAITILGIVGAAVGVADPRLILIFCALAIGYVTMHYIERAHSHSQAGVERLRTKTDHKLDMAHERNRAAVEMAYEENRHTETMQAIQGDIEVKLKVLDLATGYRKLVDRKRGE